MDDYFVKQRHLWQPSAWRLLNEDSNARFLREVVPSSVEGIRIRFPDTDVTFGWTVRVRSKSIGGRALLEMIYEPELCEQSLTYGMIALKALHGADLSSPRWRVTGGVLHWTRGPKLALSELLSTALLTPSQRKELARLLSGYFWRRSGRTVLVHGDLQATHVIVDLPQQTLGIIDLEAVHLGKASMNFAQLWDGYYLASPRLGCEFYRRYVAAFPHLIDEHFDTDVRAELALRSYSHVKVGRQRGNVEMEIRARTLLTQVLSGMSFAELCQKGASHNLE